MPLHGIVQLSDGMQGLYAPPPPNRLLYTFLNPEPLNLRILLCPAPKLRSRWKARGSGGLEALEPCLVGYTADSLGFRRSR